MGQHRKPGQLEPSLEQRQRADDASLRSRTRLCRSNWPPYHFAGFMDRGFAIPLKCYEWLIASATMVAGIVPNGRALLVTVHRIHGRVGIHYGRLVFANHSLKRKRVYHVQLFNHMTAVEMLE